MAIPIGHSDKDTAEVAAQRRQELEKFAADATQEIATLAKKRQNDILDGMQQRIKTVTAETNLLPPSAVRGVIADSAKASTDESKAVIATIAETNPLLNSVSWSILYIPVPKLIEGALVVFGLMYQTRFRSSTPWY